VGTSNCGANKVGSNPTLTDPYSYLNANPPIPTNTCGSYPQGGSGPTLSNADPWGSLTVKKCGDTRLTADINVTNANTVLVVYNGYLDLNGHTLKTTGSGSLTVILSGTVQNGGSTTYNHIVKNSTGSGTLDIAGPTSGTLSGVALYQDKRLTGSKNAVDMTYNGNDPTLRIQGLVYMPNSNFTMKGAINLHSGGNRCIAVVAKTILVSGQGAVFGNPTSQCSQSGLAVPGVPGTAARQALVR